MVRTSKRDHILNAIVSLIERDGLRAVTLDNVAAESHMTRAGLLYHFPSREALIRATHEYLCQLWEEELEASAGKPYAQTSQVERHEAYVKVSSRSVRRVELLLMLESVDQPELGELWQRVIDRWAQPVPEAGDEQALLRFIARLAADGLWSFEALSSQPLSDDVRFRVIRDLVSLPEMLRVTDGPVSDI